MFGTIFEILIAVFRRNPDLPWFIILFGIPLIVTLVIVETNWKKVIVFIRIFLRYSVVLAQHLARTTYENLQNYAFNFRQFSRAIKVRMDELEG